MPVVEPNVTKDKLLQLVEEGAESQWLDFKETGDLSSKEDLVEVAKDVGAMQVDGGFIVVGVDSQGRPTGRFTEAQAELFDEATLRAKLAKWIPEPFDLKVGVHHHDGNLLAVVYVGPSPEGCCIFRASDVFVRHGTASERAQQHDLGRIFARAAQRWAEQEGERFAAHLERALAAQQAAQATIELSAQQRAVLAVLTAKNERLGAMYLGAQSVLRQRDNPDRISLAAHGMREVMEELYVYIDVPVPAKPPSMKAKVQALRQEWVRVAGEAEQAAEITGHLRRFLVKAREFFDWFDRDHPTRLQRVVAILRRLDPSGQSLPAFIEDQRAREWKARHEFFDRVAHHGDCSNEEFEASADAVERLLLDYLRPRTFDEFATMDAIIEEGEKDA
jgi:Schlafen, AlbA_2